MIKSVVNPPRREIAGHWPWWHTYAIHERRVFTYIRAYARARVVTCHRYYRISLSGCSNFRYAHYYRHYGTCNYCCRCYCCYNYLYFTATWMILIHKKAIEFYYSNKVAVFMLGSYRDNGTYVLARPLRLVTLRIRYCRSVNINLPSFSLRRNFLLTAFRACSSLVSFFSVTMEE